MRTDIIKHKYECELQEGVIQVNLVQVGLQFAGKSYNSVYVYVCVFIPAFPAWRPAEQCSCFLH